VGIIVEKVYYHPGRTLPGSTSNGHATSDSLPGSFIGLLIQPLAGLSADSAWSNWHDLPVKEIFLEGFPNDRENDLDLADPGRREILHIISTAANMSSQIMSLATRSLGREDAQERWEGIYVLGCGVISACLESPRDMEVWLALGRLSQAVVALLKDTSQGRGGRLYRLVCDAHANAVAVDEVAEYANGIYKVSPPHFWEMITNRVQAIAESALKALSSSG